MGQDLQTRPPHAASIADAILASVLDPTITIDDHGVVQSASHSVLEVFGWTPDELVGENISVLMPREPHGELHDDYLARYRATGETHILGRTRRFEVLHREGHTLACDLSVARVEIPGSDAPLFTGSFRDVTARERALAALRESEQRFHAAFDQEHQFVGLLTVDGDVLEVNRTALQAIGATRAELNGLPFWETAWWSHSRESRHEVRRAIERAAAGELVRFQVEVRCHDDRVRLVDFSLKPVVDDAGEVVYLLPEGRDVTQVRRAHEAENAMLRSLAAIGESAAVLAHEIKSPITAINIALRAVADQLGQDQRVVLEELAGRLQRLDGMMQRTLSFAKPLEFERAVCPVSELLDRVLRDSRTLGQPLTVKNQAPQAAFLGSLPLMEEVLSNFVRNASEAVGNGGRIVLSAWSTQAELCLSVEDDGPGVSPHVLESLFKPFVTTKRQGTGLGLAISQKIVVAHGGRTEVGESVLGGARFSVYLPQPEAVQ